MSDQPGQCAASTMKNYTPIPDDIVSDLGLIAAAVWGRMWRYAQMQDGVCRASLQTIADGLDINRRTVIRCIERLERRGLLRDLTPEAVKTVHKYLVLAPQSRVTESLDTGQSSDLESLDNLVTLSHQSSDTKSLDETQSSDLKSHKESNIDSIKKGISRAKPDRPTAKPPPTEHQIMFGELQRACNVLRLTGPFSGWANREAKSLHEAGFTVEDVRQFKRWWDSDGWRKQKQPMNFKIFSEKFDAWVSMGKPTQYIEPSSGNSGRGSGANKQTTRREDGGPTSADMRRILAERERERQAQDCALPDMRGQPVEAG